MQQPHTPQTPQDQSIQHPTSRILCNPDNTRKRRLNAVREQLFPRSPFYTASFDYTTHSHDWALSEQRRHQQTLLLLQREATRRALYNLPPTQPLIRQAFDGALPSTNLSPVLGYATIWTPAWRCGKSAIAPWPSKHELEYEGTGRITTDPIHRRFLPLPRVLGNETVNWQQRSLVPQTGFDDFARHPGDEGIFFANYLVEGLEFGDEEGLEALGSELMEALEGGNEW